MKLTVYVPGGSVVVGVQENVPVTGDVPWTWENLAPGGSWLAERVRVRVGTEGSVAVTVKVTVVV